LTRALPPGSEDNVTEMVVAYARSDLFVLRRATK
jgi:hypothetical protein